MILENKLAVSLTPEALFPLLQDLERVAPCLPGATITERVDPTTYRGRVTVKVGPITVAYEGTATVVNVDPAAYQLTMRCEGRDPRGAGSASATITATVEAAGTGGAVGLIRSDVSITGRIAQFGRGVIEDVASRILTQFAECLERSVAAEVETGPISADTPAGGLSPVLPRTAESAEAPDGPRAVRAGSPGAPATPGVLGLLMSVLWGRIQRVLRGGGTR
ncbi:MAG TPA: SRPBCC family protein [Verrucomicrobiae bacterium]|nr:SRPBCC family protein [Verrucomicrobiae bacterium]